jgi:hypothetical protein
MHFSSIIFPVAILAGLVLASPIEERGTGLSTVESAVEPKFETAEAEIHPSATAQIEGSDATSAKPGTSKRSEHNELADRSTSYGTLILCTGRGCSGACYGYSLPVKPYTCYGSITYNSLYVRASSGLTYGVFVGPDCRGLFKIHPVFRDS